jgi:hypothetical protein
MGLVDIDAEIKPASSALEALREDFLAETDDDLETLPVKARPGYEVRYSTLIPYEQYAAWRKASEDDDMPGGLNELRLGCLVLAGACRGIVRHGEDVLTDGKPLAFGSPAFHDLLGVSRSVDAVRRFYGRDPYVTKTASKVLAAAGWAPDSPDPTPQ